MHPVNSGYFEAQMFSDFPHRNKRLYQTVNKHFSVITAFIIACALFVHTFDSCSSHVGALANAQISIAQVSDLCTEAAPEHCEICASRHPDCSDSCDILSEVAVRNSAGNQFQLDAGIVISSPAILSATPIELILPGSLDPRAGPAFAAPISVILRNSLPSRAPPLFV